MFFCWFFPRKLMLPHQIAHMNFSYYSVSIASGDTEVIALWSFWNFCFQNLVFLHQKIHSIPIKSCVVNTSVKNHFVFYLIVIANRQRICRQSYLIILSMNFALYYAIVNRHYFALSTNSGEQFNAFASIAAWLLQMCGKHVEQPQEVFGMFENEFA